jgi:hypothetical protein
MGDLLFQGNAVLSEKPGESTITFPFFRDGVQWVEFSDGLAEAEMMHLLELLTRFRMLKEEAEDDLVTAMWGAEFQHIKYKTANEFWDIDPVTEIAALKVSLASQGASDLPGSQQLMVQGDPRASAQELDRKKKKNALGALLSWMANPAAKSPAGGNFGADGDLRPPEGDPGGEGGAQGDDGQGRSGSWELSGSERSFLDQLANEEARKGFHALGMELALALFPLAGAQEAIPSITKFLAESVRFCLARAEFTIAVGMLRRMEWLASSGGPGLAGSVALFRRLVSSQEILDWLALGEGRSEALPVEESISLNQFLAFLEPDCAKALAEVAAKVKDAHLRAQVLGAVADRAHLGGEELAPFVSTALAKDDILTLMQDINRKNKEGAGPFLMGMSRHVHPDIRNFAVKILLDGNPGLILSLPHLLAEPEPRLARQIHHFLGKGPNANVEKAIIDFLRGSRELQVNRSPETVLLNFRTLGLAAATSQAVAFAAGFLQRSFKTFLGLAGETESLYRKGAILALLLMGPPLGQREILEDVSHSLFRGLKKAYSVAEEEAAPILQSRARARREPSEAPQVLAGAKVDVMALPTTSEVATSDIKLKDIRRIKSLDTLRSSRRPRAAPPPPPAGTVPNLPRPAAAPGAGELAATARLPEEPGFLPPSQPSFQPPVIPPPPSLYQGAPAQRARAAHPDFPPSLDSGAPQPGQAPAAAQGAPGPGPAPQASQAVAAPPQGGGHPSPGPAEPPRVAAPKEGPR